MRLLVTGGAGFIGSNFILHVLAEHRDCRVVNLDKLTYAGNPANLRDVEDDPRYLFVRGDVAEPADVERAAAARSAWGGLDAVVHLAAESHVDRSIADASPFVRTNVVGTQVLLEAARRHGVARLLLVSTDEVYGSLAEGEEPWTEESPLRPNSPYAASKAAADLLVLACARTHGLPVLVTRCCNNYGPRQFPEKLVPLVITRALAGDPVPVYGDGRHVRDWLHVEDHCRALDLVLRAGRPGEVYHVGGGNERRNLEVVRFVLRELGIPDEPGAPGCPLRFVPDRPGHDRRYALAAERLRRELGWRPRWELEDGLRATVRWYVENRRWWEGRAAPWVTS